MDSKVEGDTERQKVRERGREREIDIYVFVYSDDGILRLVACLSTSIPRLLLFMQYGQQGGERQREYSAAADLQSDVIAD